LLDTTRIGGKIASAVREHGGTPIGENGKKNRVGKRLRIEYPRDGERKINSGSEKTAKIVG